MENVGTNNKEKFERNCPECKIVLLYVYKTSFRRAIKNNSLCKSCSKTGENHPLFGRTGPDAPMFGRKGELAPMYGKHHTDETKELMSLNHSDVSGDKNPMYGITGSAHPMFGKENKWGYHTEESKKLMSEATSGKNHPNYGKIGELSPIFGRKHTEESKKLMSLNRPDVSGNKNPMYGRTGENSPNWKGGSTSLNANVRNCSKYSLWRTACFNRDKYTCQFCGIFGSVILNVDHIKPFSVILKENNISSMEEAENCQELWNMNNGRTLCLPCHKKTETYGNVNKKHN